MPETSFHINSNYNKCSIDPTEISCVGGPENPKMQVWLNLELNPGESKQFQPFIILSIEAKLRVFGSSFEISSGYTNQTIKVNSKFSNRVMVELVLSSYKLLKIEEKRVENFKGSIDVKFRAANIESFTVPVDNIKKKISFMTDITDGSCTLDFEIPQSFWITKHLTGMAWEPLKLFELPSTNEIIPAEYQDSLKEIDCAQQYFSKGDYDKVVAHCRSAIDPIKKSLPTLKSLITSKSSFEWIDEVNESTYKWLEILLKQTANFTSKTHHPPSVGHFSRHTAQVVLMITTSIVGFAGKCMSDNIESNSA